MASVCQEHASAGQRHLSDIFLVKDNYLKIFYSIPSNMQEHFFFIFVQYLLTGRAGVGPIATKWMTMKNRWKDKISVIIPVIIIITIIIITVIIIMITIIITMITIIIMIILTMIGSAFPIARATGASKRSWASASATEDSLGMIALSVRSRWLTWSSS